MKRLALFARWPEPGRVKTRLSPALPPALACDLYRAMLEDAIACVAATEAGERYLYWAGAPAERGASSAPIAGDVSSASPARDVSAAGDGYAAPSGFHVRDQQGGDLGARLERAFDDLLRAPGDRAVVLGADCPALEPATLRSAFEALDSGDLVLGPATDGGYYLVALARRTPELFRGIEWSTGRVLEQTLARAAAARLAVTRLPALDDLDTPEDLLRWIALRAGGGGPAGPRALDAALRAIALLPPG